MLSSTIKKMAIGGGGKVSLESDTWSKIWKKWVSLCVLGQAGGQYKPI